MLRSRCVLALSLLLLPVLATAAPEQSASWLLIQMADQASANAQAAAHAGHAKDARTWRDWETLYRKNSLLPQAREMSAVALTRAAQQDNTNQIAQAQARGDAKTATFFEASRALWIGLEHELRRGGPLPIRLPEHAMLNPIQGLPGTPWEAHTVKATASDCAVIARNVRSCQAQVAQISHENMTGLYSDQSDFLLVRQQQCHRWEEMQVAYCRGR